MSVMGLKKKLVWEWIVGVSSIRTFFVTLQSPLSLIGLSSECLFLCQCCDLVSCFLVGPHFKF